MRLTIAENVAVRALAHPDRPAIDVLGGPGLTYGAAWRRVVALAGAIGMAAPGPHGRMVAVLLDNTADALLAYLACQWAGVTAVPVNSRLAAPEVGFIVGDSGARLILADAAHADVASRAARDHGAQLVSVETIPTPTSVSHPALGTAGRGTLPCVVGYTSGTTGFPKGALYSNDHYLTALMRWGWTFGLTDDHVMLVPGPLFHLSYAGLSLAALCIGARVRIMPSFDAGLALDEFSGTSTFAFLVPSMTGLIAQEWQRRGGPAVAALRFMISSGAPGPLSLTRTALRMFGNARVCEAYGWTEGGWVTFEAKRDDTLLAHSVGWPTFGNEVGVFAEDGTPCGVGEAGEVGVKGVTHFDGYLGRPEATEAAWRNGYVMSGDIGIWQADGRLCIVDRKKDMIITGGENVYTAEVERVLHEHPAVLEAAVVGLPDDRWGEQVTAAIVAREGAMPDAGDVQAFCRERLAGYKVPRRIELLAALPRNPMGKVQKFRIIEVLTNGPSPRAGG
ncbi:class I adenylate-forming enzyme family protein [Vineibacter terrae]|uniref:class I adenylate-forming enzyme family protein n=1 Tax=Vineibacter terrae TaxID=2586908 RepID=UPI0015B6590D|nr:AMP-binding protein [Vineibacter terrae]